MPAHKQLSEAQERVLLRIMQENPKIANCRNPNQGMLAKKHHAQFWESVASRLNSMGSGGSGITKTPLKWRYYWSNRKHSVRRKTAKLRAHATGTGDGPTMAIRLTNEEEIILKIMRMVAPSVKISYDEPSTSKENSPVAPALAQSPSPTPTPSPPAPAVTPTPTPSPPAPAVTPPPAPSPRVAEQQFPDDFQEQPEDNNLRAQVKAEQFDLRQDSYERAQEREEELHRLKVAEAEEYYNRARLERKRAEELYHKSRLERESAEELLRCNRAKRERAELELNLSKIL